ncbi:MAG: DNA polymerase III subunit gamma and tau [Cellulomonadaceae bacterium]|nr:DNA polymerase III subunit gamma and tau [Cellulomonadaceae bacterium]
MTQALYRRYRPETFAEVIGQEHVTGPLMQALRTGRVNHAYLFSGPRGCGKTTSARILARTLNCAKNTEATPTDVPCGTCESCVELARSGTGSLDVIEIDAASHGGVDDARDLRERATFAPTRDRFKIYIIDEAHMVTQQGFNALLKIVEEPPPHIKFIFATTDPDKVIGTIRSRTHHYPFRLVPPEVLGPYLESLCVQEGTTVDDGVIPLVIRAGAGSVRDSLSVLDQLIAGSSEGRVTYDLAVSLLGFTHGALLDDAVDAISAHDGAALFGVIDNVISTGHPPTRFVEDLLQRFRDLIVVAVAQGSADAALPGVPPDQKERMHAQAAVIGLAMLSHHADVVNTALTEMTGATSPRLHLELLCARLLVPVGGAVAMSAAGDVAQGGVGQGGAAQVGAAQVGAGQGGAGRSAPSSHHGGTSLHPLGAGPAVPAPLPAADSPAAAAREALAAHRRQAAHAGDAPPAPTPPTPDAAPTPDTPPIPGMAPQTPVPVAIPGPPLPAESLSSTEPASKTMPVPPAEPTPPVEPTAAAEPPISAEPSITPVRPMPESRAVTLETVRGQWSEVLSAIEPPAAREFLSTYATPVALTGTTVSLGFAPGVVEYARQGNPQTISGALSAVTGHSMSVAIVEIPVESADGQAVAGGQDATAGPAPSHGLAPAPTPGPTAVAASPVEHTPEPAPSHAPPPAPDAEPSYGLAPVDLDAAWLAGESLQPSVPVTVATPPSSSKPDGNPTALPQSGGHRNVPAPPVSEEPSSIPVGAAEAAPSTHAATPSSPTYGTQAPQAARVPQAPLATPHHTPQEPRGTDIPADIVDDVDDVDDIPSPDDERASDTRLTGVPLMISELGGVIIDEKVDGA